jgi:hypothetical protein
MPSRRGGPRPRSTFPIPGVPSGAPGAPRPEGSRNHSCAARAIAEREVHEDINPRDIRVAVGYRSLDRSVEV